MPGRLPPLIVVDVAGVVKPLPLPLWDGAAHDPDTQFPAQRRQGLLGRAALLLAVGAEHLVFIGAAEHLRQHHQLRPPLRRPADQGTGPAEVLRLVPAHHQLNLPQLQRHTVHM